MSKQGHRGRRSERPREEESASQEPAPIQSFAPINYATPSGSNFPNAGFNRPIQPPPLNTRPTSSAGGSGPQLEPSRFTTQPPPGKVAIPALKTPQSIESSSKSGKKGRTSHACDHCRKAKAGCTGGQPCQRCRNARVACVYGDGKRDKERKRISKLSKETDSLSQHNSDVTEALQRIRLDGSLSRNALRAAIDDVLAMTPTVTEPEEREESIFEVSRISSEPEDHEGSGENDADAEVGSTGSLDVINVDTDRDDTRGTGHMGKSSSVAWTKRTAQECRNTTKQDSILGKRDSGFTTASYHTEDADMEYVDTSNVNMYDWPELGLADTLVQSYFEHVHDAFPIVDKASFMFKYRTFPRGSSQLSPEDQFWLGELNTIFAISAIFAHLTKSQHRSHHHDHLIYSTRAKMLCMGQEVLYQDPRVATICALGLLCLYYITTGRLNRAWTICGLSIRHALTLGLHVRSEAMDLSDVDQEHRVRLWWSLYSLECLLNELTGRPSCISDRDISTPLPVNIGEDDFQQGRSLYDRMEDIQHSGGSSRRGSRGSRVLVKRPSATYQMPVGALNSLAYTFPVVELPVTSSTYFIYRTQLSIISHEIVTQLYCAATIKEKWSEVQDTIRTIDSRLLAWRDKLPKEFDITSDAWARPDWNDPYTLPRTGLAMMFNSSRMILFRPCLCRFEGRIKNQSKKSTDFNQEAAETCVHSARIMIRLLSWSTSSVDKLYAIPPWWNTLHYLCEALSVLLLEMAFQSQHLPDEASYILDDAKKGTNWLVMMSDQSVSARKAWEIYDSLIRLVAQMIKWSVFDLPIEAPVPPGYNWRRFSASNPFASNTPQDPLTEVNLQEYQAAPGSVEGSAATSTSAWTNPNPDTQFQFTTGYTGYDQVASNPLDPTTALQRFSSIGQIHGHYDDPWQHMFGNTTGVQDARMVAPDVMEGQLGQGAQLMGGSQDEERFFDQSAFEVGESQFAQNEDFAEEYPDPEGRVQGRGFETSERRVFF